MAKSSRGAGTSCPSQLGPSSQRLPPKSRDRTLQHGFLASLLLLNSNPRQYRSPQQRAPGRARETLASFGQVVKQSPLTPAGFSSLDFLDLVIPQRAWQSHLLQSRGKKKRCFETFKPDSDDLPLPPHPAASVSAASYRLAFVLWLAEA